MTAPTAVIEQTWTADGVTLTGTLQMPSPQREARPPAVLLLSGSGPLDRDSNTSAQTADIANAFAEHLAAAGIASLRYDKRGIGSSGGDYLHTGFGREGDDAASALDHLSTSDRIDTDRIGVVGHSAGATQAIRLAASTSTLAATVLLAGASSCGERVMEWQSDKISRGLPGPDWFTGRLFRAIQRRSRARLSKPDTAPTNPGGVPMSGQWLREYMAYDPAEDLRSITSPMLAITGGKDLQVDPGDLATIAALVAGPCRTESPPDLTHILRTTRGRHTLSQYSDLFDIPVDPALLATVAAWLTSVFDG